MSSSQSEYVANEIEALKVRIEESQALEDSLAPILDELMEETLVCHSLLEETSSSGTLVNHVKKMKAIKAQKEVELEQYKDLLRKAYDDIGMLTHAYNHQCQIASKPEEITLAKNDVNQTEQIQAYSGVNDVDDSEFLARLKAQLNESERKVNELRSTLMNAAEENERAVNEVEARGLSGAVRLARTLRDELLKLNQQVKSAHEEEDDCHAQLQELHAKLKMFEKGKEDDQVEEYREEEKEEEGGILEEIRNGGDEENLEEESASQEYETESEYTSSSEEDEYTDEEDESVELPSAVIARGKSSAVVSRETSGFSLDLWDLICRIIGLGKTAMKETKEKTVVRFGRHSSGIMIV